MKEKATGDKCPAKHKNLKALKLLVVEDHAEMRTSLCLLFKLLGCQARFTSDAASARLAAAEERFDILLSDINLPDGNGWDVLRELKEKALNPKVAISMSGSVSGKDAFASRQAGFDFHLIKPFGAQELTVILDQTADALTQQAMVSAPLREKKPRLRPQGGGGSGMYSYF